MKINYCEQLSAEWFDAKVGKIGGTKFSQVISGRKNRLVYELLNESLNGYIEPDDYVSDDMLFGTEQEPIARKLYSEMSGIEFAEVGMIESETSAIHIASPDGLYIERGIVVERGIVLEIKTTQNGSLHLQRYFEGVESGHLAQICNYFAVSDDVKEVHFVSFCPDRVERPLVVHIFTRSTVVEMDRKSQYIHQIAERGRAKIAEIEEELPELKTKFLF